MKPVDPFTLGKGLDAFKKLFIERAAAADVPVEVYGFAKTDCAAPTQEFYILGETVPRSRTRLSTVLLLEMGNEDPDAVRFFRSEIAHILQNLQRAG
jgi:hypothetical protein